VPYVFKKVRKTLKFLFDFNELPLFERYALLSYLTVSIIFIFFFIDIEFEIYWDRDWEEVKHYYYLPEKDVYYTGFDVPAMEYLGVS